MSSSDLPHQDRSPGPHPPHPGWNANTPPPDLPPPTPGNGQPRTLSTREIIGLIAVELPKYDECFTELARWRERRGHEAVEDQVPVIWRNNGFGSPVIAKSEALAIWGKIPGSSRKKMAEYGVGDSFPLGSFIARALTLSNGQ